MSRLAGLAIALGVFAAAVAPACAESDAVFFRSAAGHWTGPGEIVAGKYKGTKFVCDFAGLPHEGKLGLAFDGSCRVGLFSQKMSADVVRSGDSYKGAFLDGADGKGLDIVSGVVDRDRIVVGLDRKQLKGAMIAHLADPDTMNITVSVQVAADLVPVIGMSLKRADGGARQTALSQ